MSVTPPRRVLVVITRRIGDVLLATPVIRSFRQAWPDARISALVFAGTESVLSANPDLEDIITVPRRPSLREDLRLHASLLRRYDVAVSLLTSDRATLYACMAGRVSAGLQGTTRKDLWKRTLLDRWVAFDDRDTHTVRMNLAVAEAIGVTAVAEVVVSWSAADAERVERMGLLDAGPYAVLHVPANFNYKLWTVDGWIEIGRWLSGRGHAVYLSGSRDPRELDYVRSIAEKLGRGARNIAGELSLSALGYLLSRAALYVGPDTSVTHMAAAAGTPTIALYGPSNPVKWGPWPRGFDAGHNPWQRVGTQRCRNVTLIQGSAPCVPCMLEGCGRHTASFSECLQRLSARSVINAIESAVDQPAQV